jgi:anti-sigma-K factor RskA
VLSGMLTSGHAALQLDALTALMFSAWPQFEPLVASLAADESADAAVRAEAADVLEAQRESGWNRELR